MFNIKNLPKDVWFSFKQFLLLVLQFILVDQDSKFEKKHIYLWGKNMLPSQIIYDYISSNTRFIEDVFTNDSKEKVKCET